MTHRDFDTITKEFAKIEKTTVKGNSGKKAKCVDCFLRKYRLTFNWNESNNKYTIELESERHSIYHTLFVWDRSKTEKSFQDFLYDYFVNQPNGQK